MRRITLIPGDGIGTEITKQATRVVEAAGVLVEWEFAEAGLAAYEKHGTPLPQVTINSIARNRVALKGPLGTPIGEGFRSANVGLRKEFNLFAGVRPVKIFPGIPTRFSNDTIDLVMIRENIEDFYGGTDYYLDRQQRIAEATGIITRAGSEQIFRFAFGYARQHARKHITIVHKANIIKCAYGLFLRVGREVAQEYPDIVCDDRIVDNMAMQLVLRPGQFDVIVAPNLFGDIISDLCAGLVGGLGFAPSGNIGKDVAIFEAVHGTAPDIAGKNIANPTAIILSAALMLEHIGEKTAAQTIRESVSWVLAQKRYATKDVDPKSSVSTSQITDAIIDHILS